MWATHNPGLADTNAETMHCCTIGRADSEVTELIAVLDVGLGSSIFSGNLERSLRLIDDDRLRLCNGFRRSGFTNTCRVFSTLVFGRAHADYR